MHELVRPGSVQQGGRICRFCNGKEWDVFYVVMDEEEESLKFGITSRSPRRRLREHAKDGYTIVIELLTGLPQGAGLDIERAVKGALRLAGVQPVRGAEYFDAAALALVLDIVDNHPDRCKAKQRPMD
ncbi:hypothetical protein [Streptomyces sp. NPDC096339]|uniref:hypothetical protein n=1 Tax=Streptomyces sp. NPDC096339 TaxID=3366086 RepID=UPI003814D7EC